MILVPRRHRPQHRPPGQPQPVWRAAEGWDRDLRVPRRAAALENGGSTNLDNRSFALNEESNVVSYNQAVARRLEQVFEADVWYSERVDYKAWKSRGLKARLLEWLAQPGPRPLVTDEL